MKTAFLARTSIEMIDVAAACLARNDVPNARALAAHLVLAISERFGGGPTYLGGRPDGRALAKAKSPAAYLTVAARDMMRLCAESLSAQGVAKDCERLAQAVIMDFATLFGGRPCYVARNHMLKTVQRDAMIFADSGKLSVRELAAKYDLCVQHVYKIIDKESRRRRAERQATDGHEVTA